MGRRLQRGGKEEGDVGFQQLRCIEQRREKDNDYDTVDIYKCTECYYFYKRTPTQMSQMSVQSELAFYQPHTHI